MSTMTIQLDAGDLLLYGVEFATREAFWRALVAEVDSPELPDDDITPDEAEPLPPDEPVKTDPIPEETE